jgi:hypothetical protein
VQYREAEVVAVKSPRAFDRDRVALDPHSKDADPLCIQLLAFHTSLRYIKKKKDDDPIL